MIDREEFERFYRDSLPRFAAFARRLAGNEALAQDIVQESYFRFLRGKFASANDEERRRYLYRIAINLMKAHWRETRLEAPVGQRESTASISEPGVDFDVTRILLRLTPRERSLLVLAYAEGRSHREIAEILDISRLSVRVLLSRARKHFIESMETRP